MTILITEGIRGLIPAQEQAKNGLPAIVQDTALGFRSVIFAPREWADNHDRKLRKINQFERHTGLTKGKPDPKAPVAITVWMYPEKLAEYIKDWN